MQADSPPARNGGPAGGQDWTIKKVLDFADSYFRKAGIENPHLEAEILLAHALGMKRIDLYLKFENELNQADLEKFRSYILRRKSHEPTAYIIGTRQFMSMEFQVTKDTLIPRPETEILVELAEQAAEKKNDAVEILDIGTGSGAIAVSVAKLIPAARVTAIDISAEALAVAENNALKHGVADRITFEQADIVPADKNKLFDLIISNPPYIMTDAISGLASEVKDFEPRGALDGGKDGLKYYIEIMKKAPLILKDGGCLILEIDPSITDGIRKLSQEGSIFGVELVKDFAGLDRAAVIRPNSRREAEAPLPAPA